MVTWLHCFWAYGETDHQDGECKFEEICSIHGNKEAKYPYWHAPNDLLPPTKSLLKVPQLPVMLSDDNQAFTT
jgi:hypothetical protein